MKYKPTTNPTATERRDDVIQQKQQEQSQVKKKLILMLVSATLLIVAVVYLATAWYTKMVNVSDLQFDVAQWEFSANNLVDDILLKVYDYNGVEQDYAAPGTAGFIPVDLSMADAQTDIYYTAWLDTSGMSEQIAARIAFSYLSEVERTETAGTADDADENATTPTYTYTEIGGDPFTSYDNIDPTVPAKVVYTGVNASYHVTVTIDDSTYYAKKYTMTDSTDIIGGTLTYNDNPTERIYIYWEWIYEFIPTSTAVTTLLNVTFAEDEDPTYTWSIADFGVDLVDKEEAPEAIGVTTALIDEWREMYAAAATDYDDEEEDGLDANGNVILDSQADVVDYVVAAITDINNEYDTAIGKDPTLYADEFEVIAYFTGKQVEPTTAG